MASTMKKIYAMLGAVFALFGASLFAENGKIEILDLVMLFDENVERQAQDLKKMSAEKVADVHMISFFLVPREIRLSTKSRFTKTNTAVCGRQ